MTNETEETGDGGIKEEDGWAAVDFTPRLPFKAHKHQ